MRFTFRHTKYACYLGFITQAININLAPVLFVVFQTQFGYSYEQIGRLVMMNFCVQIAADLFATRYVDRIGYRPCVLVAFLLSTLGLALLGVLPNVMTSSYAGLATAVALYSFGSGLIEVLISPIVEALPGDEKATAMSLLHSFYCWGQMAVVLLSTLAIWRLGARVWPYLSAAWALVPVLGFAMFLRVPLASVAGEHGPMPVRQMLASRFFLVAMLLMTCSGSAELSMSQWSSLFAEKGLGVSKLMGDLLGPCLFALCMGVVRALYGVFGAKLNIRRGLVFSAGLCLACYLVAVFSVNAMLSLIACAACGLSVALMWPGTLSYSARRFPLGGTALFGVLALSGDVGGAIGPWMAGLVSDLAGGSQAIAALAAKYSLPIEQASLKCGLLAAAVFPALLLLLLLLRQPGSRKGDAA